MMIIPAKFKVAAIVSVAVISVSAGAVGSSQQQAKPGMILSDSQLTLIVGNTDQGGSYSPSGGSMLLGSDESELMDGVRSVQESGRGYRVRVAACLPRNAVCTNNTDCCSGSCNFVPIDKQRECE